MAYFGDIAEGEEQQQQQPGTSATPATISGTGQAGAPMAAPATSSGRFTNLQQYLAPNVEASESMSKGVKGKFAGELKGVEEEGAKKAREFTQGVSQKVFNIGNLEGTMQNWGDTGYLQGQEQSIRSAYGAGNINAEQEKQRWATSAEAAKLGQQVSDVESRIKGLEQQGNREAVMREMFAQQGQGGQYGGRMAGLDAFLLGSTNPQLDQGLAQQAAKVKGDIGAGVVGGVDIAGEARRLAGISAGQQQKFKAEADAQYARAVAAGDLEGAATWARITGNAGPYEKARQAAIAAAEAKRQQEIAANVPAAPEQAPEQVQAAIYNNRAVPLGSNESSRTMNEVMMDPANIAETTLKPAGKRLTSWLRGRG